jgi:hypothetical protein
LKCRPDGERGFKGTGVRLDSAHYPSLLVLIAGIQALVAGSMTLVDQWALQSGTWSDLSSSMRTRGLQGLGKCRRRVT